MSDDNTPIDGTRQSTDGTYIVHDGWPTKSVNDMKAMIAKNNIAIAARGERALTIQEHNAAVKRGEHPLSSAEWWQLGYNDAGFHVSLHLKQDKLHEARTKN